MTMIETGFSYGIILGHRRRFPAPADNSLPDDTWFPIERILSHKKRGNKVFYRVKWADAASSPSWEASENVTQCAKDEYFIQKRDKAKQRRKRYG